SLVQEAGIPRLVAPTIGIAVDHRRRNPSEEAIAANVARLKAYKSRLIVFPRKSNKPKAGDSAKSDLEADTISSVRATMPIMPIDKTIREISKDEMPEPIEGGAYTKLRMARSNARLVGVREKRAKEKAEADAAKK